MGRLGKDRYYELLPARSFAHYRMSLIAAQPTTLTGFEGLLRLVTWQIVAQRALVIGKANGSVTSSICDVALCSREVLYLGCRFLFCSGFLIVLRCCSWFVYWPFNLGSPANINCKLVACTWTLQADFCCLSFIYYCLFLVLCMVSLVLLFAFDNWTQALQYRTGIEQMAHKVWRCQQADSCI